jgi:hypothetical protein
MRSVRGPEPARFKNSDAVEVEADGVVLPLGYHQASGMGAWKRRAAPHRPGGDALMGPHPCVHERFSLTWHLAPRAQLLGFQANATPKDSDVNNAFEEMLTVGMSSGYSQGMLSCRTSLLRLAKTAIFEAKGKSKAAWMEAYVPEELIPIALALLAEVRSCREGDRLPHAHLKLKLTPPQTSVLTSPTHTQVGESHLALQLGDKLLVANRFSPASGTKHDVLLSMALAYCNLAGAALEAGDKASAACQHLDEALQLLRSAGAGPPLAPDLAEEIQSTLQSLRAPSILEELLETSASSGKPSVASMERRKRAVRALRELLKSASGPSAGAAGGAGSVGAMVGSMLGVAKKDRAAREAGAAVGGATAQGKTLSCEMVWRSVSSLSCEELVHLLEWEQVARNAASTEW